MQNLNSKFDSMYKRLNGFQKKIYMLKNVASQANENKDLQEKVLNDVRDNCIAFTRINTMKKRMV